MLKSVNASADANGYAALKIRARGLPIDLYDGYWPSDHVGDFMAACDAYVSLHRSEGTGLTIAEAMALGKPVIATDWSGNTDFADSSNSFPVGYALTPVERNVGPYRAGETWAEPDVDHAAELMREVVADRTRAARRGAAAAQRIARDYSEVAIGALVRSRLEAIASRQRLGALRTEVSAFVDGYRHLVDDIRTVVANVVPPGEIVAVVSRGDSALLPTSERPAWHFPEARPGVYAGYHPADSAEAIDALEAARARGAGFFLLPGTAYWWLDHYAGLSAPPGRTVSLRVSRCPLHRLRRAPARGRSNRMKPIVVVSGVIANKPHNGGNARMVLNWLVGLERLGVDVYFVEQLSSAASVDDVRRAGAGHRKRQSRLFRSRAEAVRLRTAVGARVRCHVGPGRRTGLWVE